ncbi:MAG: 3D-(3,5/4)-trihydroxycyclohexane-1,2-dione acylhydrolase (decyclizing) [Pseudomonadota bacterium]
MKTRRMTTAQALIRYLHVQHVMRDGRRHRFFGGVAGIFGHGNVAGIGQALQEVPELPYMLMKNEQAAVHMAVGYARMKNRLGAWACTSSIGPGATNMITGAALATISRLPVLLLPGDIFARRNVAPVLQQLESEASQDVSVNDCFRPVSRYWDRINRPEQLIYALPEVMRVLTSPAQCGAVTLCLPQDVQAEAWDFPGGLFEERTWPVPRPRPDREAVAHAADLLRHSRRPLIIAGGGVIYSDATETLTRFTDATGVPVGVTQAGKGALPSAHPHCMGGIGVTGTPAANVLAREADLVIGIGTRYSDFTTASTTAFQDPHLAFVNLNISEFDAFKNGAHSVVGDARESMDALLVALDEHRVDPGWTARAASLKEAWGVEIRRIAGLGHGPLPSQGEVLCALNDLMAPTDVLINAAGSAPGDLHKLWRISDPLAYHVEYGYSCMGYEIPGGLGHKLAAPEREVVVLVGDGTWLMMNSDLATAVQEGVKLTVVLIDNHGFASIGGLSNAVGSDGFGTKYRRRGPEGALDGEVLPLDFEANARSLGARTLRVRSVDALRAAWPAVRAAAETTVVVVETDRSARVPGYESWWDVPVAEVSEMPAVREAREAWEAGRVRERCYHGEGDQ